jgi:ribosomal-protein-alanine N-acetyltransferase
VTGRAKTGTDVLVSGREKVRTGPWRGDGAVAYLAPVPDVPSLSAGFVQRCLAELAGRGYASVITAALLPSERQPFLAAGFAEADRLRLLTRDLRDLPERPAIPLRRAKPGDRPRVLEIDAATFPPFWRLDDWGLDQAVAATPTARFRVAPVDAPVGGETEPTVAGYVITGRAGAEGYVQRLAVDPAYQRRGIARALVIDGLHWLRHRAARRAAVNTQVGNDAAYALYVSLGFTPRPSDLVVLRRELG